MKKFSFVLLLSVILLIVIVFITSCSSKKRDTANVNIPKTVLITGRILSSAGTPVIKGSIVISYTLFNNDQTQEISVKNDGAFSFKTDKKTFRMIVNAVNHKRIIQTVVLDKASTLNFDIIMPSYKFKQNPDSIGICGNFNNWDWKHPLLLSKDTFGKFYIDIKTKLDTIKYQIINATEQKRTINGTMADDYLYDNGGDYISVIYRKSNPTRIEFDPARLSSGDQDYKIITDCPELNEIRIMKEDQRYSKIKDQILLAAEHNPNNKPDIKQFAEDIQDKIENEKDDFVKSYYYYTYLLTCRSLLIYRETDQDILNEALETIEPDSPLWSINSNLLYTYSTAYKDTARYYRYIKQVIAMNHDPEVRAEALWTEAEKIKLDRQMAAINRGANLLSFETDEIKYSKNKYEGSDIVLRNLKKIVEECPGTYRANKVKTEFFILQKDDDIPDFELKSLDNKIVSKKSLLGKCYLLDFWATWCGPCLGMMEDLHKLHERLNGKNFEILSISLDNNDDEITKFRKEKWPMPWFHARLPKGFKDDMAKNFSVEGIPKTLLISKDGKVLATNWKLGGPNFIEKIEKLVADQ
ncbi:MAG: thioredoxin-like domain-containing protein [Methanococcaceae archaeon]